MLGLAHVCLITGYMTLVRARLEVAIPKKRGAAASAHDKVSDCEKAMEKDEKEKE